MCSVLGGASYVTACSVRGVCVEVLHMSRREGASYVYVLHLPDHIKQKIKPLNLNIIILNFLTDQSIVIIILKHFILDIIILICN